MNSGSNRNSPPKLKDRLKRNGTYPRACAGDPEAEGDMRAVARRMQEMKRRARVLIAASAVCLISTTVFAPPLTNIVVARHTITNITGPTSNESRVGKKWAHTNVYSMRTVYLIGEGLPRFTNDIPFLTNWTWYRWHDVTNKNAAIKSPKDR